MHVWVEQGLNLQPQSRLAIDKRQGQASEAVLRPFLKPSGLIVRLNV